MAHHSEKQEKTASPPELACKRLSAKNRKLLKWLDEWKSTPDEMGKEWWDEFEKELRENRLTFRREQ